MMYRSASHWVLLAIFGTIVGCSGDDAQPVPPPPAVEVARVTMQAVLNEFEFVSRTRASEDAEIRARVTGNIVERAFNEGQVVEEGSLLFRIDPRPYQAALHVAQAEFSPGLQLFNLIFQIIALLHQPLLVVPDLQNFGNQLLWIKAVGAFDLSPLLTAVAQVLQGGASSAGGY